LRAPDRPPATSSRRTKALDRRDLASKCLPGGRARPRHHRRV